MVYRRTIHRGAWVHWLPEGVSEVQRSINSPGRINDNSPWCGAQLRPGFCCTETRIYTIPRTIMRSRNDQRVKTHSKPCITNGKRREYVTVAEQHCSNGEIAHSVLYCCSPHLSSIIPLAHTIMFFWRTGKDPIIFLICPIYSLSFYLSFFFFYEDFYSSQSRIFQYL